MEKNFDYINDMVASIEDYLTEETDNRSFDSLYDELWAVDEVTHNLYTHNEPELKTHVLQNMDTLKDALYDFGSTDEQIAKHFVNEEWGYFDTILRCYLLGAALQQALENLEEKEG